jgi:hypothetical protein
LGVSCEEYSTTNGKVRERGLRIANSLCQQGPCDACQFVGQRDRDDLERTPRQELCEPRIFFGMLAGTPQDRVRTNDQDATQVARKSLETPRVYCRDAELLSPMPAPNLLGFRGEED